MQKVEDVGTPYEETVFYIVEVHYEDNDNSIGWTENDDNSILGWTEKEHMWGESIASLRQTLEWIQGALDKPILIEEDLLQLMEEVNARDALELDSDGRVYDTMDELLAELSDTCPFCNSTANAPVTCARPFHTPEPRLTISEVLDSLGLERVDVESWENESRWEDDGGV